MDAEKVAAVLAVSVATGWMVWVVRVMWKLDRQRRRVGFRDGGID